MARTAKGAGGARRGKGPVFVAFLRGINVGGKNKLPMAELTRLCSQLGCADVGTYVQSGNVVFRASAELARALEADLAAALRARFGLSVPVILRTAAEIAAVARANPFLKAGAAPETLHVAFLASAPAAGRAAGLDPERSPGDAFALRGRELYLHLPNGVARTKLSNAYLDRTLDTTSTLRNWRTVQALLERTRTP
jgi:uncharacterized protein (DUF1697 family)